MSTNNPNKHTTMYKITKITTERGCTHDGRTFTVASDACDSYRNLITFPTIRAAELYASNYAKERGFKYLEIGDLSEPGLNETFVEIRTA